MRGDWAPAARFAMREAYVEAVGGLSGDMMLGALVDAGLPLEALQETIEALGLTDEVTVSARPLSKCGISATKVDVQRHGEHHHHHQPHEHTHEHSHPHADEHGHGHDHQHEHEHEHGRSAAELMEVVRQADLDASVIERSLEIIRRIAEAEAKIHDTTPEEVHFHEIGGLDTLVDVVGAVEGLRRLGIERLHFSPLPIGHGWVRCAHGLLPVPAPATAELLRGLPTTAVDILGETVTPTGAALAAVLADGFGRPDSFVSGAIGYGCGNADFDPVPNIVRLSLGADTEEEPGAEALNVTVIEANIDDMSGELVPDAIEAALNAGALDCWAVPIIMKKGRPALLLRAICEPAGEDAVAEVLLRETTSLGVRMVEMRRRCLQRRAISVETRFGEISVKLGYLGGEVVTASPEYTDCRRAADEHGVTLKQVYAAAIAAAQGAE